MSGSASVKSVESQDWDLIYRQGTPPWDTGQPAAELVRAVDKGLIQPGPTLEMGCGTGADAVFLAQRGFEVTAIDSSPIALERARLRAESADAAVHFVLADVFDFTSTTRRGQFDLVYDAGFYHFIRQVHLDQFLDMFWRITRPGSHYLTLVGSREEPCEGGPPQVSEEEIRSELGRMLEFVHLRRFQFESRERPEGYQGWSCLLRRPEHPSYD